MAFINLNKIQKTYILGETKVHALRGVDLSLERGEFAALIGASGSGKSTLLHILGTIDHPDQGTFSMDDQDVLALNEDQKSFLRNEKIGFIFQSFHLVPVLDVYENVELPLLVSNKLAKAERNERVLKVIENVGLLDFLHHPPNKLSGGQRQRVAIARALVTHPSLILADEPTANLDSDTTHRIVDLLLELNSLMKVTFLFCTHDEKLMSRVSRHIRIQDGLIVDDRALGI
jgi:putative ABC transport system ATP-binding protein